jgi:NTP pyrophosphatase (non-canonical NTP hydrolase)
MTHSQRTKCEKIAERYGCKAQERQTISELSELMYCLTRRPDQRHPDWANDLIDEIADVTIMLQQMMHLYDISSDEINERINYKLQRQLTRMDG